MSVLCVISMPCLCYVSYLCYVCVSYLCHVCVSYLCHVCVMCYIYAMSVLCVISMPCQCYVSYLCHVCVQSMNKDIWQGTLPAFSSEPNDCLARAAISVHDRDQSVIPTPHHLYSHTFFLTKLSFKFYSNFHSS